MSSIEHFDFVLSPLHPKYFQMHLHSMPEPYIMFETATLTSVLLYFCCLLRVHFYMFLLLFFKIYFCIHALDILGVLKPYEMRHIVDFIYDHQFIADTNENRSYFMSLYM